jgi:hypothetical protein
MAPDCSGSGRALPRLDEADVTALEATIDSRPHLTTPAARDALRHENAVSSQVPLAQHGVMLMLDPPNGRL